MLADATRALEYGLSITSPRLTVRDALESWLEARRGNVRPQTYEVYRQHALGTKTTPAYLGPLHAYSLTRLNVPDVRRWLLRLRAAERPLSDSTIRQALTVLRMALKQAVGDGLVPRNVAQFVEMPKAETRREAEVLTLDQIRRFFVATKDDRLAPLYVTAFATGLRQGELLGLRWSDVALDAGTVTVAGQLRPIPKDFRKPGDLRLKRVEAKTETSYATLPLAPFAVDRLAPWRERQRSEPASVEGLVFTSARGTPLDGRNVTRLFKRALRDAGLPQMPFHAIRHCTMSVLLAMGLTIDEIRPFARHGSTAMTWRYTHVMPELARRVGEAIQEALG